MNHEYCIISIQIICFIVQMKAWWWQSFLSIFLLGFAGGMAGVNIGSNVDTPFLQAPFNGRYHNCMIFRMHKERLWLKLIEGISEVNEQFVENGEWRVDIEVLQMGKVKSKSRLIGENDAINWYFSTNLSNVTYFPDQTMPSNLDQIRPAKCSTIRHLNSWGYNCMNGGMNIYFGLGEWFKTETK